MFSELLSAKPKMSEGILVITPSRPLVDMDTVLLLVKYDIHGDAELIYFQDMAGPYLDFCGLSVWDFGDVGEVGEYAIWWLDA